MDNVIINSFKEKYLGKYVALANLKKREVVSYGKSPARVYRSALKKGYPKPVLFFVPEKDTVHIY